MIYVSNRASYNLKFPIEQHVYRETIQIKPLDKEICVFPRSAGCGRFTTRDTVSQLNIMVGQEIDVRLKGKHLFTFEL
jgi:hypothetical protein